MNNAPGVYTAESNEWLQRCPICLIPIAQADAKSDFEAGTYHYNCERCGRFVCHEDADDVLPRLTTAQRVQLGGVIREQSETAIRSRGSSLPFVRNDNVTAYLINAPRPFDISTKVRKLLSAIARRTAQPGEWQKFSDATDPPLAYAANVGDWIYLSEYANEQGWIEKNRSGHADTMQLRLTPAGWEEAQRRPRIESAQGFVAMRFHSSTDDAFEYGIKPAIEDDCHYECRRIDAKEFNGDIVDELMAEIRESRFVVSDLTGHRRGVYFEAGFAMGLDIPVIWTCRSDRAGKTHFDAEHFNQIRWETPADLRKKLAIRIRATIGLGPVNASTSD